MSDNASHVMPLDIAGIDKNWMTEALRTRAPGVTCNGVEVVDINPGTCTKVRLRLDMDDAGKAAGIPELVMLKGGFETHSRAMSHVHLAEARGYRDVFPVLGLPTPICYFADFNEEQQQGIVIMEDLVARGVEFCSALKPHSFDAIARRFTALGRFHAAAWGVTDTSHGGQWSFLRAGGGFLREYMNQYLAKPAEWQRFVDAPRGAAASVKFHDLERIVAAFDKLTAYEETLDHCVLHGDTHLGNLFVYPDGRPGFFDGLPGRGAGMKEVTYHMTCALDTADRRRWEGALVQHYIEELQRGGAEPPSFDEMMKQFSAFLLTGFIIFIVNESFYQPESVNTAYTARFSAAMLDHRTLELLEEMA